MQLNKKKLKNLFFVVLILLAGWIIRLVEKRKKIPPIYGSFASNSGGSGGLYAIYFNKTLVTSVIACIILMFILMFIVSHYSPYSFFINRPAARFLGFQNGTYNLLMNLQSFSIHMYSIEPGTIHVDNSLSTIAAIRNEFDTVNNMQTIMAEQLSMLEGIGGGNIEREIVRLEQVRAAESAVNSGWSGTIYSKAMVVGIVAGAVLFGCKYTNFITLVVA